MVLAMTVTDLGANQRRQGSSLLNPARCNKKLRNKGVTRVRAFSKSRPGPPAQAEAAALRSSFKPETKSPGNGLRIVSGAWVTG